MKFLIMVAVVAVIATCQVAGCAGEVKTYTESGQAISIGVNQEFTIKDGKKQRIADMRKLDPIIYALDNYYYKIAAIDNQDNIFVSDAGANAVYFGLKEFSIAIARVVLGMIILLGGLVAVDLVIYLSVFGGTTGEKIATAYDSGYKYGYAQIYDVTYQEAHGETYDKGYDRGTKLDWGPVLKKQQLPGSSFITLPIAN